jgi:hypothetical protein
MPQRTLCGYSYSCGAYNSFGWQANCFSNRPYLLHPDLIIVGKLRFRTHSGPGLPTVLHGD